LLPRHGDRRAGPRPESPGRRAARRARPAHPGGGAMSTATTQQHEGNRMNHREERVELAAAFRLCNRFNMNEGIANHFSYMLDGPKPTFLVNPRGMHFKELTASRLIEVDMEGNVVEGEGQV